MNNPFDHAPDSFVHKGRFGDKPMMLVQWLCRNDTDAAPMRNAPRRR